MANACVLLTDGFEEIEAVTVIDVFRRAGIETTVIGVGSLQPRGAHGLTVLADEALEAAKDKVWDLVVLPGGMPGATHLRDHAGVRALVQRQHARRGEGAKLAAICAAPIALEAAGILAGRRVTSYPGFREQVPSAEYHEDRVVVDGELTTSRGPGTALAFALSLVEQLAGPKQAASLKSGMLVAP